VDSGVDLYRYDVADDALTRISAGVPGAAADVSGVIVLASDDGTRVYFLATGELVAGAGEPGRPSLYLSDRGHLRFIAGADDIDLHAVAMTSDGRTLAFTTAAPLLPSDADGNLDLYRYDAATHGLEEVSVGLGDRGNEAFDVNVSGLGVLSSPFAQSHPPFMSADGSRILFATGESLVPEDANQAPDVYERADGDLGLITSGTGDDAIAFGGISADGRSVFFTTDEALLPADRDQGDQDLYVARLGGGFPALAPPSTCEGEACQGAPGGTLRRPDPASLGFVEPPPPARIHVHPLGRRTARRLAATGRATIVVDVPVAGRISVVARTRIDGQATVVAHDAATARGATSVRLHLRLAAAARRLLQRRGTLSLKLVVRHSTLGTAPVVAVRMRRAA
jgi:hypothetical protein